MPILTIEAIRENPWNVVTHTLPTSPERLLLEVAYLATHYCRQGEYVLMTAARDGDYTPEGWEATTDSPDVHEESEARSFEADQRLQAICDLYEKQFDEQLER